MKKRKAVRRRKSRSTVERTALHSVFLPDCPQQVRLIAMQGAPDDEIARTFGIHPEVFQTWKKTYPDFAAAIENGRSHPDQNVTVSLYQRATGYDYQEEVATKHGIRTLKRHAIPDVPAIKEWLHNRVKKHWGESLSVTGGRNKDGGFDPLLPTESRNAIIESIVALVQAKPDGETNPGKKK